jgi:hypothetical protein
VDFCPLRRVGRVPSVRFYPLAEMFLPDSVFSYIASTAANSADGTCAAIAALESIAEGGSPSEVSETEQADEQHGVPGSDLKDLPEGVAEVLADWRTRADVMRWGKVKPGLAGVSLKPYLFVIKDRRNYLSADAPLSPALLVLFSRLTGGAATAASTGAEIRKLGPSDLEALLVALRAQVLATTSFDTKPMALLGIERMVREVPILQERYLDVLEALPAQKLGGWAATGHGPLVTSEATKTRLAKLVDRWQQTGGALLKRGLASTTKEAPRRRRGT